MKLDKPFDIRVQPFYNINEPMTEEERLEYIESTALLGGYYNIEGSGSKLLKSGGRMEWMLYRTPNSQDPHVNIQLMRIWCVQMFTQMINGKAFTNELNDVVEFKMTDDEETVVKEVINRLTTVLNDKVEKSSETLVPLKKNKKVTIQ